MRKVLGTTKSCPIISLYLTLGQTPARFEITKMRLLYLKYILEQPEETTLRKILNLQLEKPTRGDWVSTCQKDIEKLNLKITFSEIKSMKKKQYTRILKERIKEESLKYLLEKQGKKGRENKYPY